MKHILMAAWANDNTRGLMRWVAVFPMQYIAWHSVVRFVGRDIEAAMWTWLVGFAFMMFTEKSAPCSKCGHGNKHDKVAGCMAIMSVNQGKEQFCDCFGSK